MNPSRVLIVEDERIVQLHLQSIVGALGHEVVGTATSPREALARAAEAPPDLVLMDIHLAEDGDGVETARALTERCDCAVVFVTAYADEATVARTAPIAAAGYLVKPFCDADVRAAITTALSSHGRRRSTEQRERSLAQALDTMESVFSSRDDAVFVVRPDDAISFANRQAGRLLGVSPAEACDRNIRDVLPLPRVADRDSLASALDSVRRNGGRGRRLDVAADTPHPLTIELESMGGERGLRELAVIVRPRRAAAEHDVPVVERPFGKGTRLLVYSHDTFGLGHLRRSLNLIRGLLERHPDMSALLMTGSPMVHRYPMPKGSDYLKLPAVRKVADERYEARSLSMSDSGIAALRSNLLLRTVRDYDPNVLLVDHSPLGMKGEMRPALDWLRSRGRCTNILGLRDVIDDPQAVRAAWSERGTYDAIDAFYDRVVVYGSRSIYDTVETYGFPAALAARTDFVNYVCDAATGDGEPVEDARDPRPLVAVTIGGGDGAEFLIRAVVEAVLRQGPHAAFRTEIVTGPFADGEGIERLRAEAAGLPIVLRDFVPSIAPLYRRADLVVSTCGYNTATDLLCHARRALVVPRVLHRQEQAIRARRFAELGLWSWLHPDELTPEGLGRAIETALAEAPTLLHARREGTVPLDGSARFAELCGTLRVAVAATL